MSGGTSKLKCRNIDEGPGRACSYVLPLVGGAFSGRSRTSGLRSGSPEHAHRNEELKSLRGSTKPLVVAWSTPVTTTFDFTVQVALEMVVDFGSTSCAQVQVKDWFAKQHLSPLQEETLALSHGVAMQAVSNPKWPPH